MLKEVGASGQISLGKKYAGQLFDVVFAPNGRVELVPALPPSPDPPVKAAKVPGFLRLLKLNAKRPFSRFSLPLQSRSPVSGCSD